MVYDALQKRTAYLDALACGLEVLGVKILISMFPDVCKPAFVWDGKVWSYQVASMMKPVPGVHNMDTNQRRVWEYLMNFVNQVKEAGMFIFMTWLCVIL